jgi:acyl-CoA synthetase (AMP-forming)/AMP-acid ligase II
LSGYRYESRAFRATFERHFTYLTGFSRNVHRYADRPALSDAVTDRRWTYAELGGEVDALAAGLVATGVRPREVIVFQLFNTPEFALLWLAAQRMGAIACPINFRLSPGETAHVLDDSTPAVYFFDAALVDTAWGALDIAEHRPDRVIVVDPEKTGATGPAATSFAELADHRRDAPAWPHATAYDETTRLYTSGTTGQPKGVSLNAAVEILTAHDVIMHFPLTPEDKTLNMTPWFHRGGLYSGGPSPVFYVGAESVALRHFDAATVLDLVADRGLSFLIGAPTNLALLSDEQEVRPRDLGTLRGIVTMGAPLERAACLRYQEVLTPDIFNGYGTTEAFWNTFLRPSDLPEHAGSAGRACTDDDVAVDKVYPDPLAAPDDLAAKDGTEVGEVIVRSMKAGQSYVDQGEDQKGRFRAGWLYIGDLAVWDAQEYVTIVGRKDDMILSGGENVYPMQVEEALNSCPAVQDSIVVGMPDEQWGERVVAYVVCADRVASVQDLDRFCRAHPLLAQFKRPRAYRFVEELPMTPTGKKMRFVLREQAPKDDAEGLFQKP